MKRREFVRSAVAVALAPAAIAAQTGVPVTPSTKVVSPGPLPWMLGLDHVDDTPVPFFDVERISVNETHLFTKVQMETLVQLCDVLMPAMNGLPGATESLVPEFLDFFVSRSAADVKALYQTGLDMLEGKAHKAYGSSFASLSADRVDALIRPLLVPWMKDHLPKEPEKRFLNRVHYDTRLATMNSGAWAVARVNSGHPAPEGHLYWFPVEPDVAYRDTLAPGGHR